MNKAQKQVLKKDLWYCPDCEKKVSRSAKSCPHCGAEFDGADEDITRGITRKKSPEGAAILSILFGPFGYLYTRRYGLFGVWLFLGPLLAIIPLFVVTSPLVFAVGPLLLIGWAIHNYSIATKINEELKKK